MRGEPRAAHPTPSGAFPPPRPGGPCPEGRRGRGAGRGLSSSRPAAVVEGVSERRAPRAAGLGLLGWTPLPLRLLKIKFPSGQRVFHRAFQRSRQAGVADCCPVWKTNVGVRENLNFWQCSFASTLEQDKLSNKWTRLIKFVTVNS